MRFTTLNEWLRWQEGAHPNAIDLGLARVQEVAQKLGVLLPDATVITVAGTNGKGSCIATLSGLLGAANKSYGAYTSPHILKYNERVSRNGVFASDDDFCQAFEAIDQARGDISLTYFEFGTLAAMYLFSLQPLDFWLLEVGLGGRLDAVNIVDPDIAIITSIDIDHIDWLGDNRESIGFEKAGICRPSVPLICADASPPMSIFEIVKRLECPMYLIGKDFGFDVSGLDYTFWGKDFSYACNDLSLPASSVAAALQAMDLLGLPGQLSASKPALDFPSIINKLELPGRMQVIQFADKTVVLDVAHNPAAMRHLAAQLKRHFPSCRFDVVLAMMQDKDIADCIRGIEHLAESWCLTSIEGLPRSAAASDLSSQVCQITPGAATRSFPNVSKALSASLAGKQSYTLVTGSFYCVSEATEYLEVCEEALNG